MKLSQKEKFINSRVYKKKKFEIFNIYIPRENNLSHILNFLLKTINEYFKDNKKNIYYTIRDLNFNEIVFEDSYCVYSFPIETDQEMESRIQAERECAEKEWMKRQEEYKKKRAIRESKEYKEYLKLKSKFEE